MNIINYINDVHLACITITLNHIIGIENAQIWGTLESRTDKNSLTWPNQNMVLTNHCTHGLLQDTTP